LLNPSPRILRINLLTLFDFLTKPKLFTLRVSSAGSGKPGTYEAFWLNSAFAAIIADSDTEDGESGMVAIDDRRKRTAGLGW
jgi:hypothetical protein